MEAKLVNESIFKPLSDEQLHKVIFGSKYFKGGSKQSQEARFLKILPFLEVKIGMKVFPSYEYEDLRVIAKGTATDLKEYENRNINDIDYINALGSMKYSAEYARTWPGNQRDIALALPHVAIQVNGKEIYTELYNPDGVYVLKNEQY